MDEFSRVLGDLMKNIPKEPEPAQRAAGETARAGAYDFTGGDGILMPRAPIFGPPGQEVVVPFLRPIDAAEEDAAQEAAQQAQTVHRNETGDSAGDIESGAGETRESVMPDLSAILKALGGLGAAASSEEDQADDPEAAAPALDFSAILQALGGNKAEGGEDAAAASGGLASMLPSITEGGGGLSGMLGMLGGGHHNRYRSNKMQLLLALKPYLHAERQTRVDRICNMVNTAYGVRSALHSLGGMLNV